MAIHGNTTFGSIWAIPEPTTHLSPSGEFSLRVDPDEKYPERYGHCRASLYRKTPAGATELLWDRYLCNNWAPRRVMVLDSGQVVTLGEWGEARFHTPFLLALYRPDGELVQVHTWEGLGLEADRDEVSYAWMDYLIPFFIDDKLYLQFHWGRLIAIGTRWGYQVEPSDAEWPKVMSRGRERLRQMIPALLKSDDADDRIAGTIAAQHLQLREAIPQLRVLLKDPHRSESRDEYYFKVRAAAKEALETMGEEVGNVELSIVKTAP